MNTSAPRLTLDEFLRKHGGDNAELIDGVVVPLVPAGMLCGHVAARTVSLLGSFVNEHKLGVAWSNDAFVLIRKAPPRVRGADFCFWANGASPEGAAPEWVIEAPPELCVELRSLTYDWPHILEKVSDYLAAGVKAVLVLDPYTQTACAFRPNGPPLTLSAGDELTLPDVLPGFAVPVARFFE
ncbi:MAG: Uma2 family endonuclease [Gemmata sp.]